MGSNFFKRYKENLRNIPHLKWRLTLTVFHTVFLIALTFILQYINITRFDETAFFKWFAIVKHNILRVDKKPALDSVIFLDISKDLELVEDTSIYNYGSVVIKNRSVLANFFSIVNKHPNKNTYILCDLSFDYPSPNDTLLKREIEKVSNLIAASTIKENKPVKQLFDIPNGSVDYTLTRGAFVKIPIFDNDIKSLPVKLLESNSHVVFTKKYGLTFKNKKLTFNTIIPEFYYRPQDLIREVNVNGIQSKEKPNLYYLGEILADTSNFFEKYLTGKKYIIIGDFTSDLHLTYLGRTPGSLILFNTFLTLRDTSFIVSWRWLVLLFLVFFGVSYFIFIQSENRFKKIHEKVKIIFIVDFIKKYVSNLGILILLNMASYGFFGVFISLFYLATYLTFLELIMEKRRNYTQSKKLITLIKEN